MPLPYLNGDGEVNARFLLQPEPSSPARPPIRYIRVRHGNRSGATLGS